jgi:mRNA interferase MazF
VTVANVTTQVRRLDAEVALGPDDGMPQPCVVNLDSLVSVRRSTLSSRITTLGSARMREVDRAIHLALGIPLPCRTA